MRPRHVSERGAAAVEFALVAVLLITLLMGVIEFGRMWAIQGSLAQASRDAARTAAITDSAEAGRDKFDEVFWPLAPGAGDSVNDSLPARTGGDPGDETCRWTVAPTYETGSITGFFGDEWTIRARGAMRCNG